MWLGFLPFIWGNSLAHKYTFSKDSFLTRELEVSMVSELSARKFYGMYQCLALWFSVKVYVVLQVLCLPINQGGSASELPFFQSSYKPVINRSSHLLSELKSLLEFPNKTEYQLPTWNTFWSFTLLDSFLHPSSWD